MNVNDKITEISYYNTLCNGNYKKAKEYIPYLSYATIQKYIKIGENLDYELRELLDEKGKKKMTIGLALKFCEVPNKDHQYDIYKTISLEPLTNKGKINSFEEYLECNICCETSHFQEKLPCCGFLICIKCLFKSIDNMVNDITFSGCKCPFCASYFSYKYLYELLYFSRRNKKNVWIMNNIEINLKRRYYRNVFKKFKAIIEQIEIMKGKLIGDSLNFENLVSGDEKEKYYGVCNVCCPPLLEYDSQVFTDIKVNTVDRECADGEGNIIVLKEQMFHCENCGDRNNEYKKCPHCGIKTLRPSACNYVICGDHRWCWICNERLPNNHDGHNVHYWTGPGTSPYSNHCRKSLNYNGCDFVLDYCDCRSCIPHDGMAICRDIDCYKRCKTGDTYCSRHQHI